MIGASDRHPKAELWAFALSAILALVMFMYRAASDGLMEMGDGVNHYLIARYAWEHPILLLDLWGKPLFTLLSSPFAAIGHAGMAGFNAVVAMVTAWVAIKGLRGIGGAAQLAYPVLLILAPQYVMTMLAGMTEPLFGLVTVLTVVLLLNERPTLAAAVASFAPFARPEYVAFIPAVMLWLVIDKRWRVLPWTLLGFAVYMLLTEIVYGDLLWFWMKDPYGYAGEVYGSGPWDFFISRAEEVYGRPLLVLGVSAVVLWPIVHHFDKAGRRYHRMALLVAAGPALGIVAVHSILWWQGWRGSAGLLRVLATSIPLAAFFTAYTLGRGGSLVLGHARGGRVILPSVLLPLLAFWCASDLTLQVDLPVRKASDQLILDKAAMGVKQHRKDGAVVYSTHPYMAFGAELDPHDQSVYNTLWGLKSEEVDTRFRTGDLILWEAQLGPNECHIPLEQLLDDERFAVLEILEPRTGSRRLGGYVYEFFLFERRDVKRWCEVDTFIWNGAMMNPLTTRVDTVPCPEVRDGNWCLMEGAFPFEMTELPMPSADHIYDEWSVSGVARSSKENNLKVVLKQKQVGEDVRYDEEDVPVGDFHFERRVPRSGVQTDLSIYFWNIGEQAFGLENITVVRKRWNQVPAPVAQNN